MCSRSISFVYLQENAADINGCTQQVLSNFEAELIDFHKQLEAEMKNGVACKKTCTERQ